MNHVRKNICATIIFCLLNFIFLVEIQADNSPVLDAKVKITNKKEDAYSKLKQLSEQTGYMFIYDSQLIPNERIVKLPKGEYTLRQAIILITGIEELEITIVRNHILLRLALSTIDKNNVEKKGIKRESEKLAIGGTIRDRVTKEPIPFCAIGIHNSTIGTVTNQDGHFKLIFSDSLVNHRIKLSHVGYQSEELDIALLVEQTVDLTMEPKIVSLQEIVVRVVDPLEVLSEMIRNKSLNYPSSPTYITAFYREGVEHKKRAIDLTEAVLKVYKTGYQFEMDTDQAKLVKMRRIKSPQPSDTIFTKIKSGIYSCLFLDIMKNFPDFLDLNNEIGSPYIYKHTDITYLDDRRVNVISFEPQEFVKEPLFVGELYLDADNFALVEARFQIDPKFVKKATSRFIERKNKDLNLTLESASYSVSYKFNDGIYYINHIRCDIEFKVKKKRRLFSTPLHLWLEMVNCRIDTDDVVEFSRDERISTRNVFADTKHYYDQDFWRGFNIILPEEKLENLIINSINRAVDAQLKN